MPQIWPSSLMVWVIPDINMLKNVVPKLIDIFPLIVVITAFPFFFFGGANETSSNLFGALWDCGHLVFFVALVMVLGKKFDVNSWRVGLVITATVFFGGGLIEIIQANIGRDGNWGDLLRDLTGTWVGLFWLQRSRKWVWVGRFFSIALLIPNLTAVFFETWYQLYAMEEFPLLAGFESQIELFGHKGKVELSDIEYSQGLRSGKIELTTNRYSGITFDRLFNDWSSYKWLAFDIYNPDDEPLIMNIRVNDTQHILNGWQYKDRFNRQFSLGSGWNHLRFSIVDIENGPERRKINLAKISHLVIFASRLPKSRIIYLDNLRLE